MLASRQMAGEYRPSTVTVSGRVPLLLQSKSAVTHLAETLACLGLAVSIISFPWLGSDFHFVSLLNFV